VDRLFGELLSRMPDDVGDEGSERSSAEALDQVVTGSADDRAHLGSKPFSVVSDKLFDRSILTGARIHANRC
jgi:hypothetical protein